MSSKIAKISTNNVSLQTISRRRRINVLDQKDERSTFGFLAENSVSTKVIEILGIRKTWSVLGTIPNESLPYIEHTRLCLVWLLEWGFW